jgi:two-component system cell cycle response regulator
MAVYQWEDHSVGRVYVVDDSAAVRSLLCDRLRAEGHEVEAFPDAAAAVERITSRAPDVVVTDLMMPGLSGVQFCRLLRSDIATTHIPVVLLTASGDKRSRFWARSAGAAAYVSKDRLDDVIAILPGLVAAPPATPPSPLRGRTLLERVSAVLDDALFESVVAGEVRSLARSETMAQLFEGLCRVLSEVLDYRWLALLPKAPHAPLFVHANIAAGDGCEKQARAHLGVAEPRGATIVADDRPSAESGRADAVPYLADVVFADAPIGRLALSPSLRGLSRADERLLAVLTSELAGPLQMTALHEDARRLASTDPLTGLLNRRAFLDALERERSRADRHGFLMSLLLIDVDHFKRVNDQHGHASGDLVLRGIAEALLRVARRSDYVGRWGGEEFVLALPQTGSAGAMVAAERLRLSIQRSVHRLPSGTDLRITASVGVASADSPWSIPMLLTAADEAMYHAKAGGRNRIEVAPILGVAV